MLFGHSTSTSSKPPSITGSSSSKMTANQEQLLAAEVGLHMLMDDNIEGARTTLQNQGDDSPFALAGLGICDFLAAAVGMEDERLTASMDALAVAEKSARKHKHASNNTGEKEDAGQWWNQNGMEYEVLIADLAAAQAVSWKQITEEKREKLL